MAISFIDEHFHEQSEYLAKRGITPEITTKLKLEFLTSSLLEQHGIKWRGITRGILWRIRGPDGIPTEGVGARVWYQGDASTKRPKFLTPKDQSPQLYFSPLSKWAKLKKNDVIVLCESYLKADIAALCGHYAIGISGVWGWSANKKLIDDFAKLPWNELELKLVVCWDSNVRKDAKDLLALSVNRLAAAMERYAPVGCAYLPPLEDANWGLDDFYAAKGRDAVVELISSAVEIKTGIQQKLTSMNDEVAVVRSLGRIVELETGTLMSKDVFTNVVYAAHKSWTEDGKPVSLAKMWLGWDDRNEVENVVYKPGAGTIVDGNYNSWRGMGCVPEKGDVSLFEDWLGQALPNWGDRHWFCCWWACQLQNPGIKLTTGLVLLGVSGVGKGWIAALFRAIFGRANTASIDLAALGSKHNTDYACKQLVIVEESELPAFDGDRIYAKIKDLLTSETVRVEPKGVNAYYVDNVINVMLQGNRIDIFKVDEYDRRLAIFEIEGGGNENNEAYWTPRWEALVQGLPEAVYEWLLDYDITDFNPKGKAPETAAKREMVEITHSARDVWVLELKANYTEIMTVAGKKIDGVVASAKELEFVYQGGTKPLWEIERRDVESMSRALRRARVPMANGGAKIKDMSGSTSRYFLLKPGHITSNWAKEVSSRTFWQVASKAK